MTEEAEDATPAKAKRKKASVSPTQRSVKYLREQGWTVAVVEHWNPYARIRQDLFGFADLIAVKRAMFPLLVQVTSGSNVAARITKIKSLPAFVDCHHGGFYIFVHGWAKRGPRGEAKTWTLREERILPE